MSACPDLQSHRHYRTAHKVGENNIQFLWFDLHHPVFPVSALLIVAFVALTLATPDTTNHLLLELRSWVLNQADGVFTLTSTLMIVLCVVLALSPAGRIRLGGQQALPDFGLWSWFAMLFSAGVGIGLMFWGAAEPLAYYTGWSGTPLNVEAGSAAARRFAFSAAVFHWGLTPWAVYAIVGLALAFFTFNKGLPLTLRSTFYPLLGERVWGWPGHCIDFLAVISTLFGLATSLGLGASQISSGLGYLFGVETGSLGKVLIICGITGLAVVSVVRGLHGGVRLLSNLNMLLALVLLLFVIVAGPTLVILRQIGLSSLYYVQDFLPLSQFVGREDTSFYQGFTVFYLAWWISWSPFVGMFIARVSRGRTIREFLAAVLLVPVLLSIVWFSAFGATALSLTEPGAPLAAGVGEVSLTLFRMLEGLPLTELASGLAIVLIVVFFVTSSDSGSLVIDSITAGGKLEAPVPQRVFWACMEGAVAAALVYVGGAQALDALQAGAISSALPFSLVVLVCAISLVKGLAHELRALARVSAESRGLNVSQS